MSVKHKVTIERITTPEVIMGGSRGKTTGDELVSQWLPSLPATTSPPPESNIELSDYIYIQVVDEIDVAAIVRAVNIEPKIKEDGFMPAGDTLVSKQHQPRD